jgi:hypothetical protein
MQTFHDAPLRARSLALLAALLLLSALVPATTVRAASSHALEASYTVDVFLDWDSRWVEVKTGIALRNTTGGTVDKVVLNTAAAHLSSLKNLRTKVRGVGVKPSVKGQTIVVPLHGGLAAGASVKVWVGYKARLNTSSGGRRYFFAKLNGVAQLYRFIPWLSRRIAFGSGSHGEPFLTPVSPRVQVTVAADRPLKWATSGYRVARHSSRKFTYVATDVRDFNIAASPSWRLARGTSQDGRTKILAYTRKANGSRLVNLARQELARYAKTTGVRYPHAEYRIAETGGGLAMESPALIWIPASRPAADHPYLVSHETAHQWWYSTVGNDQSTSAFADEALADYYSRKAHLSIRSSRCNQDRLDREIRSYSDYCYYEVVYVQGARFLDKLSKDYGSAKFKAAVRAYTRNHVDGIGSNSRLLEAFRAEMGDGVLQRFHNRFPSVY